ncbi:MAG: hypothetical protein KKC29_14110 [Alphaproteobacteria bacterium]|jgi:hypothetical protein|nr:hypothetical protein [Alphaproteobacteria bacterium]MBU2041540.1 hypothetical protein [Alphaproteobacteria bacterium]MBU2125813.1 hypothetical protein [Alphaproteobacteria bacterium]MBU2292223.1 hypothetical protein [Alphaproteobacteria bacterium]MBU2397595.1 hypothetical protein [Alphaproteobacteria bacterium]
MTDVVKLLRESGGSIALRFAFVGPAIFLLAVGGVDLLAVNRSQDRLQSIADGAAAAGAGGADVAAARSRAAEFVAGEMRQWPGAPAYEADYEIVEQAGRRQLRVVLRGHRPSFLANMLPPGGWHFTGESRPTSI